MTILDAIRERPLTYSQLPRLPNLDYLLRGMLKRREIVLVPVNGHVVYTIPRPPPGETPTRNEVIAKTLTLKPAKPKNRPHGRMRICHRCFQSRFGSQFPLAGNGRPGRICSKCRYQDKKQRMVNASL